MSFKDKYEISIWEDYIVPAQEGLSIPEHYEERKIAIIGSDTMSAEWRATEPNLINNVNGTNTLTFKMYYAYIDTETGEKTQNPMIGFLVNERKVKCYWKNKWYDMIIKSCQEDSDGKSITYTCKDLFINELSKNGFNLIFDTELENNTGTAEELGQKVLEGTDWQLGESDIIQQELEEPVYETTIINDFTTTENIEISSGEKILVYYSVYTNKASFFQFFYDDTQSFIKEKSSMLVINGNCLSAEATWGEAIYNGVESWKISVNGTVICYLSKTADVSNNYRAKRLVKSQSQILDPLTEKYVYEYLRNSDNKKIYGYSKTEYDDVLAIFNYITNSKDFGLSGAINPTNGWFGNGIEFQLYPQYSSALLSNYQAKSYLGIPKDLITYNSGIRDYRSYLEDGFTFNEKYIFRIKAMTSVDDSPSGTYCNTSNLFLKPWIGQYILNSDTNTYSRTGDNYFDLGSPTLNGDWVEYVLTCNTSIIGQDLQKIGIFVDNSDQNSDMRWIEQVQFFKYAEGKPIVQEYSSTKQYLEDEVVEYNEEYYICIRTAKNQIPTSQTYWKKLDQIESIRINPGSYSAQSYANVKWKFYESGQSVLNKEDIVYLYSGDEQSAKNYISQNLTPIYNNDYEKIRSITAKNSNRFNILQSIAETFECWIRFEIEHDEATGRIIYINGVPQKKVRFLKDVGKETGIGFIYGIDLKTISRTVDSDAITSKVIVSQNNNEYGIDGFCTIARSTENFPKVDFILNFDYYISQGLLSQGQINKDLYSNVKANGIGYYYWLNKYNTNYDAITTLIKEKNLSLDKYKSLQFTYQNYITETSEEIERVEDELASLAGYTSFDEEKVKDYIDKNADFAKVTALWLNRINLKNSLSQFQSQLDNLNLSVQDLDDYINGEGGLVEQQEEYLNEIEELDAEFYSKYSRFIQEGSWTSEDYYDDNLYYLDAMSTAYTSSRPQISYNISVLRLSALDEFKNKIFELGDISFVQDTEFFGYTIIDGVKTPYKEKVLISEISSYFDSPEQDSFKVQNYKTQFEDLFQRITATTQSLQYSAGAYNKVTESFTPTGEITALTLQNSFDMNQNLAWSAENDSVVYDTTGMTVVDTSNPNKLVRISSQGIYISEDGGEHWYLGISGSGISTRYLTSGIITSDKINIMDGAYPTFRWDKYGINAFSYELDDGQISQINDGNFVRFDRFGLYGIDTELSGSWQPENEQAIWNTAKFGLTWKGFFMKNKYGNGYVSISSVDDFIVSDGSINRIKIGNIGTTANPIYGISIADSNNNKVMETNDDGTLWLKNRLNIETSNEYSVAIGKLGASLLGGKNEIINANNKFLVYEDGSIRATDGEFTGTIYATGGTIGGMSIADIVSGNKKVEIVSNNGFVFIGDTPSRMILTATLSNAEGTLSYKWYKDGVAISGAVGQTLTILNNSFQSNSSSVYKVVISETLNGGTIDYSNFSTIQKFSTIEAESTIYEIVSNQDSIFKQYLKDSDDELALSFNVNDLIFKVRSVSEGTETILNPDNYQMVFSFFDGSTWKIIDTSTEESQRVLYVDGLNWHFDINTFVQEENYQDENLNNLLDLILNNETIIKAEFLQLNSNIVLYTKNIPFYFSTPKNLAVFSVNAQDINASIESSSLTFNSDGLTINNAGFSITKDSEYIQTKDSELLSNKIYYELNSDGEYVVTTDTTKQTGKVYYEFYPKTTLLEYDENSRSLYINGSGTFTGNIYAEDGIFNGVVNATGGNFSGSINALDGTIGGFIINQNSISSNDGNIQLINNDEDNLSKIIVKNIELGDGANISNYIKLGNSYIYNPEVNDNNFIVIKNQNDENYITIKNTGIASFGDITIDGVNSEIRGRNFKITPNHSEFSNIDITGTIHSSVFETGQSQVVGGTMLFRESAKIEIIDSTTFSTLSNINLKVGSYVMFIGEGQTDSIYGKITSKNQNIFTVDLKQGNLTTVDTVIHLADLEGAQITNQLLIGINSQSSRNKNLSPYAMTFSSIESIDENTYNPNYSTPKILLGDLSVLSDKGISGYGLYGENVYLTGSLTTQVSNNSYAGVNTLNGVNATKFNNGLVDTSKIVFWAGANGTDSVSIQNSKFQITENGSLYASQGIFEGSIITKSTIEASKIYTANLYGSVNGEVAALNIYDMNSGIVFRDTLDEEILRLSSNGFMANGTSFIEINSDEITFNGDKINSTLITTNFLGSGNLNFINISESQILAKRNGEEIKDLGYLLWNVSSTGEEYYSIGIDQANSITQNKNQISLSSPLVQISRNINFSNKMKYEKVNNGYDLYISE